MNLEQSFVVQVPRFFGSSPVRWRTQAMFVGCRAANARRRFSVVFAVYIALAFIMYGNNLHKSMYLARCISILLWIWIRMALKRNCTFFRLFMSKCARNLPASSLDHQGMQVTWSPVYGPTPRPHAGPRNHPTHRTLVLVYFLLSSRSPKDSGTLSLEKKREKPKKC